MVNAMSDGMAEMRPLADEVDRKADDGNAPVAQDAVYDDDRTGHGRVHAEIDHYRQEHHFHEAEATGSERNRGEHRRAEGEEQHGSEGHARQNVRVDTEREKDELEPAPLQ